MESLSAAVLAPARRAPDRPAVLHEDGAISYGALAEGAERLAGRLAERGLAGERVAILLPNLPCFPLALYGALRARCTVVMLNPMNSPREVAEYLGAAGAKAVLTASPLLELLPRGSRALLVDRLPEALQIPGEERTIPLAGAPPPPPPRAEGSDPAAILFTAAEDGWARGAVLSHRNLIANARSTVEAMRMTPDDRVVGALPYIHAFGLTVSLDAALIAGASILPVERFHPLRLLDLLAEQGATIFAGVPAMYQGLIAAAERKGIPSHSLRIAICGGAPLDPDVARRWEELFGLPLRQGYGLTEAGPVCLFNGVDRPNRLGTLGYAFPRVEVSIRDPRGSALPAGEVGEICVRGENVFPGYLGEEGRRPEQFHGEWLRTGDLGSQDEDGAVRFRGVLKPMFTRNGFNVYPRELERVLEADPRIARATACALPSPARENDIVIFLRPTPGAVLDEDEVREYCRAHLAAYKQPARVVVEA